MHISKTPNRFNGLSTEEKKALFRKNMGIAEQLGQDHNAVGLTANRDPRQTHLRHYHNASGNAGAGNPYTDYKEMLAYHGNVGGQTLAFTISNTGTATEDAVLFGRDFASPSGANITITPSTGGTMAAINNDVATQPMHILGVRFRANTDTQSGLTWKLEGKDTFGNEKRSPFSPQNWITPDNQIDNLVMAPIFNFMASNKNSLVIPIEAGNTITITFYVAAQLSLEGIVAGTNTIDVAAK